jgi:hypothetical protein
MLPQNLTNEWTIWLLINGIPAVIAATAFLLWPPWDRKFGWNVIPRASGILLGVGFLMRTAMYVQQFTANMADQYVQMRWLHWGNVVFAAVLLGVTCVWGDHFHWRRPVAIIWLFLYIEEPIWMLTLWPRSEAAFYAAIADGSLSLAGAPVNPVLQGALFIEAAVMFVYGVGLFLFNRFPNVLPFKPDLVSARVLAGWPLAYVLWAPALALSPNFEAARGGIIVNMVFLAALIVAILVFRSHFDLSNRTTRLMLIGAAALLLLLLIGFVLQR